MDVFATAQKVNIHLGHFCNEICHQELSKIAQSGGHTGHTHIYLHTPNVSLTLVSISHTHTHKPVYVR